jgi:hypothetical protein
VVFTGLAAMTLDLSDTTSLDEALKKIAAYAAAHPNGWIIGQGWNQEAWKLGRFPTAAELDAIVPIARCGWGGWTAMQAGPTAARWRWRGDAARSGGGRIGGWPLPAPPPRPRPAHRRRASRRRAGGWRAGAGAESGAQAPRGRPRRGAGLAEDICSPTALPPPDMGTSIEDWQAMRRAGDAGTLKMRIMAYGDGIDAMALIGGGGPTPWLYDDGCG